MVGIMIQMSLSAQRHSLKGNGLFWPVVGIALATGTILLSMISVSSPLILGDVLTAAFAAWMLILAFAPLFGNGGGGIRAEHFALLPISPRQLALGLLGIAMVRSGPVIALIAFSALIIYGFQLSLIAGLISILAVFLQFLFIVLLARVIHSVMGAAMQTRLGMELVALQFSVFFALVSVGWFVMQPLFTQMELVLSEGWPPLLSTIFHALPSGWGLVAVDAIHRADWGLFLGIMVAFIGLIGGLFLLWITLLGRGQSSKPVSYRIRRISGTARRWFPATSLSAVIARELSTWMRDPWRALELRIALWTGLLIGILPLLIGRTDLLPFIGIMIVLMGGTVSANLYGLDGSAFWQTMLTPGAERIDIRGRQWAWLFIFTPLSLLATFVGTGFSGQSWIWPLVLSLHVAILGATAGLIMLFSAYLPSPGIDPRLRQNALDSSGELLFELFLLPLAAIAIASPAAIVTILGFSLENPLLQWAGIPVGIGVSALFAWGAGLIATHRLKTKGPELLNLLLKGTSRRVTVSKENALDRSWKRLPLKKKAIVWFCSSLFWIPLFPLGILPLVFRFNGVEVLSVFLPPTIAPIFQWPILLMMIALGLMLLFLTFYIPAKHDQDLKAQAI